VRPPILNPTTAAIGFTRLGVEHNGVWHRAVAQFGSALDWGSRGRRFKSCQPDKSALICSCRSEPLFYAPSPLPVTTPSRRGAGPDPDASASAAGRTSAPGSRACLTHHADSARPAPRTAAWSRRRKRAVSAGSWCPATRWSRCSSTPASAIQVRAVCRRPCRASPASRGRPRAPPNRASSSRMGAVYRRRRHCAGAQRDQLPTRSLARTDTQSLAWRSTCSDAEVSVVWLCTDHDGNDLPRRAWRMRAW
jgi:hypothetical protein